MPNPDKKPEIDPKTGLIKANNDSPLEKEKKIVITDKEDSPIKDRVVGDLGPTKPDPDFKPARPDSVRPMDEPRSEEFKKALVKEEMKEDKLKKELVKERALPNPIPVPISTITPDQYKDIEFVLNTCGADSMSTIKAMQQIREILEPSS